MAANGHLGITGGDATRHDPLKLGRATRLDGPPTKAVRVMRPRHWAPRLLVLLLGAVGAVLWVAAGFPMVHRLRLAIELATREGTLRVELAEQHQDLSRIPVPTKEGTER